MPMSGSVRSIAVNGNEGSAIDIECHISNGLPNLIIVGFANKAVDESKERVRSAFANSDLDFPRKRITINLAPADLPKESSVFDLAIASVILLASKQIDKTSIGEDSMLLGELGLDGSVRPVRGIIGNLLVAKKLGYSTFYIPQGNLKQAKLVPQITLVPVKNLKDLYLDLTHTLPIKRFETKGGSIAHNLNPTYKNDFKDVVGQARAKRALEIAAAGAHNVLLNGPPGTGKSMLAKALPSILPPLNLEEILEITHLHSLATKQFDQIITERPFRAPHHSASEISIIGGGQKPRPGEISLSHQGVLFFDEIPEFSRGAIESLRQPLEDRHITVARAKDSVTFPASFILIATSNPCPCGYYGTTKPCTCLPSHIYKYKQKLSGPIIDRIDLYINVDEIEHSTLLAESSAESSNSIRDRVSNARARQHERYRNNMKTNSIISNADIKKLSKLSAAAEKLLNQAATQLQLSARAYMRTIKVARTIADLANEEVINESHTAEALQYRRKEMR